MSLTYAQYVAELELLAQFEPADPNFLANLPSCIDYATDRITRELNLLNTVTSNSTLTVTTGTRIVNLSTLNPIFNVLQDINVLTPFGTTNPDLGQRNPLTIQSRAFMNWTYGSSTGTGVPEYFAMVTDQSIMVAPYPDKNYNLEIVGTVRPTPLSPTNATNWISLYLPDLFLAASMIFMAGMKMNYGQQSDNPQMALSWEDQYTKLRDSAGVEDAQRKYFSTGWSQDLPNAYNPART